MSMHYLSLFIFSLLVVSTLSQNVLFSNCVTIPSQRPVCVNITETNCLQATVLVTQGGLTLFGPKRMSILQLLYSAQTQKDFTNKTDFCSDIQLAQGTCQICGHFKDISVRGEQLSTCGNVVISCYGFDVANFDLNCFQINNCSILSCGGNNCNDGHGVCTSLGICQCIGSYNGPDCGISVDSRNCVTGQGLVTGDICLESANLNSCGKDHYLDLAITVDTKKYHRKIDLSPSMTTQLEECQSILNLPRCHTCPFAGLNIVNVLVEVCPHIAFVCDDVTQTSYNLTCFNMPISNQPCAPAMLPSGSHNNSLINEDMKYTMKASTLFIACAIFLVVLILGFITYKGRKYIQKKMAKHQPIFMSAFGETDDDTATLNGPSIDEDDNGLGLTKSEGVELDEEE